MLRDILIDDVIDPIWNISFHHIENGARNLRFMTFINFIHFHSHRFHMDVFLAKSTDEFIPKLLYRVTRGYEQI